MVQDQPGRLVATGMAAHAVGDDQQRELMVLVQVRPGEMLNQETVLVAAALAADRREPGDFQTQGAGCLRDRLRAGRLVRQNGRLHRERLAALVAANRATKMLLRHLAGRDTVGTMGAQARHSLRRH